MTDGVRTASLVFAALLLASAAANGSLCRMTSTDHLTADCRSLALTRLPVAIATRVQRLLLSDNRIDHVPADAFVAQPNVTTLDLSENVIAWFDRHAFRGLFRLRVLNINANRFVMGYAALPRGVFTDCAGSLHALLANRYASHEGEYPADSLAQLAQLRVLSLSALRSFAVPSVLADLPHLHTLDFFDGYVTRVTRASLDGARNSSSIVSISLRNVGMTSLEPDAFDGFRHLRAINLACNAALG